jgi:hypothetical protein
MATTTEVEPADHVTQIQEIYLLNLNVILGVCFGLMSSRLYGVFDKETPLSVEFYFAIGVTFMFLLVTHIEYFFFIRSIVKTYVLADILSPLLLGGFQAAAIYFLIPNATGQTSAKWWLCEALYAGVGAALVFNSWLHVSQVISVNRSKTTQGLTISVAICLLVAIAMLIPFCVTLSLCWQLSIQTFVLLTCTGTILWVSKITGAINDDHATWKRITAPDSSSTVVVSPQPDALSAHH